MASVEFNNVEITFGATPVVQNFSLEIPDGEFVVLVGPSGCGKSTILRSVAGLAAVSSGDLTIAGKRVNDADPATRDVAMVFQSYALFPHMTVAGNLGFGLKIRGEAKADIERKVKEAADLVGLGAHLHKRPGSLSGGQRQRVALARAILRRPGVFLFDEPLSNLDAEFRSAMRAELVRFHRQMGATMIYVTHDQVEAMTMGDRIAVLAPIAVAGTHNLMQFDTPDAIYRKPANLFVARFIGSPRMNTFEVASTDGSLQIVGQTVAVSATLPARVVVGIRPEHIEIGNQSDLQLTGKVTMTENLGHEYLVVTDTALGSMTVRVPDRFDRPKVGQDLTLSLPRSRLHFFDSATGIRIEIDPVHRAEHMAEFAK